MTSFEPESDAPPLVLPALRRISDLYHSLHQVSLTADESLRQHIFSIYLRERKLNTQRRRRDDLARFRLYLNSALASHGFSLTDEEGLPVDLASDEALSLWGAMSHGLIKGMVAWLLTQGYSLETINNTLSTVKVFAGLATQAGMLDATELLRIQKVSGMRGARAHELDHERSVRRIGHKKAEATVLSDDQVLALLDVPFENYARTGRITPQNWRDALLLRFLFELGVRPGELVTRTLGDLDLKQRLLRIERHKTENHEQWLEFSRETMLAAQSYLEARPTRREPSDPLLLPTSKGEHILEWREHVDAAGQRVRLPTPGISERNLTERVRVLGRRIGVEITGYDARHKWADSTVNHPANNQIVLTDAGGWSGDSPMLRHYYGYKKIANQGVKLTWKDGQRR